MKKKRSSHYKDVCPHCNKHTKVFAPTYGFNLVLMDCPKCGKRSISDYDEGIFAWRKLKTKPKGE